MVNRSDAFLVEGVLNGDRSAFGDLYDRYARLVRSICYDATQDMTGAQDLSQEVFLRAYSKLGELRDPDRFAGWLVGIVRMVCREWRRRRGRDRHTYVDVVPDAPDAGRSTPSDERINRLHEAMRSLPERERLALHTFYLNGESVGAVRQVLGLSQSGVYRLLDRARRRLKGCLQDRQEDGA